MKRLQKIGVYQLTGEILIEAIKMYCFRFFGNVFRRYYIHTALGHDTLVRRIPFVFILLFLCCTFARPFGLFLCIREIAIEIHNSLV